MFKLRIHQTYHQQNLNLTSSSSSSISSFFSQNQFRQKTTFSNHRLFILKSQKTQKRFISVLFNHHQHYHENCNINNKNQLFCHFQPTNERRVQKLNRGANQFTNNNNSFFQIQKRYFSESKDLYKILGVSKNATDKEIKNAFRKLALEFHPDRTQGDEIKASKFKEITAAYDILSNPEKRKKYDQFGADADEYEEYSPDFQEFDFHNIFKDFNFNWTGGGGGGKSKSKKNARSRDPFEGFEFEIEDESENLDVIVKQTITFNEAMKGTIKEISYNTQSACGDCKGTGGSDSRKCGVCKGRGVEVKTKGFLQFATDCSNCKGMGYVSTKKCKTCHGKGKSTTTKKVSIEIPRGIETGAKIRATGQGSSTRNRKGHLYIHITVKPHEYFQRHKNDIILEVPLSIGVASLGGIISIPTLNGMTEIKVRSGTQNGDQEILKGRGIPYTNGNMILKYKVVIPKTLSEKQRRILEEFCIFEQHSYPWK